MEDKILYSEGELEIKVSLKNDTIWLSANDIASIFDVNRPAIVKHIGNIYKSEELDKETSCSILEQLASDGRKRKINFYNLDVIISVGYRVNSKKATRFRKWATTVLRKYIQNGFVINSEKITNDRFVSLESDVKLLKEKVDDITSLVENNTLKAKQGIFYDGQVFDAYSFVINLLREANKSIILIDNYIDDTTLTIFSKFPNIKVTIYTHTISRQVKLDLKKYNTQYNNITLKTFKNSHDRFLIIDNKELYHIGASLKDLGKKWFAFSKMDIKSFDLLNKLK